MLYICGIGKTIILRVLDESFIWFLTKCSDKEHYSLKLDLLDGLFMHVFAANQPGSLSKLHVLGGKTCIGFAWYKGSNGINFEWF